MQIEFRKPAYSIMSILPFLMILSFLILFNGCASLTALHNLQVQGVVIENHSSTTIRDVRASVEKTGGFAYCSHVYANTECSTKFQMKRYQGNLLAVSWTQDGNRRTYDELNAALPENLIADKPATLRIIIDRAGNATAALEQ